MSSRHLLTIGRLGYAGASGVALVVALGLPGRVEAVGGYTYQATLAGALAIVLTFGIDRTLARRVSAEEIPPRIPSSIATFIAAVVAGCALVAAGAAGVGLDAGVAIAVALFVMSRVVYAVIEAFWIGAHLGDRVLAIALLTNGAVTAGGIGFGSAHSAALMTALSALGNVVGGVLLVGTGRVRLGRIALPGFVSEVRGVAASSVLAVVYARSDLVILAVLGARIEQVAVFGVVTRVFDALALVRGAIAQQETRDLAKLDDGGRESALTRLIPRTVQRATLLGLAGVAVVALVALSGIVPSFEKESALLALSCVSIPLFFSHLPTTALVFADRRTHLLFVGSLMSTLGSVATKLVLITQFGAAGAVIAIGAVEVISYLVFLRLYLPDATRKTLSLSALPLVGALAVAAAVTFASMVGLA